MASRVLPSPTTPSAVLLALWPVLPFLLGLLALYGLWSVPPMVAAWGWSWLALGPIAVWAGIAALGWPLLRRAPRPVEWVLLAAIAVLLRVGAALLAAGHVSTGDPYYYVLIARQLVAGQGLFVDEPYMGIRAYAFFPPVYPLLLAGWGLVFGFSTAALTVLHSLLDLAAAWLVGRIGAALGRDGAGRAAGWLYLVWPSVLLSDGVAQKEALATVLILALALVWVRYLRRAGDASAADRATAIGWRGPAELGVLAALLALTQPGQAALAALFGLVLIGQIGWRAVLGFGLRGVPVAMVAMAPWWLRNWLVFGAFVPLTSASGLSLWIGNNADATGNWMPPPTALKGLPELAYSRAAGMMARDWIVAHPVAFMHLSIAKFFRAVGVGQFGVYRLAIMTPPLSAMAIKLLLPLAHLAHVGVLATGAVAVRRRSAGMGLALVPILLVLACLAQLALFGVWFEFGERHREFMTPFLLLAVCAAVARRRDGEAAGG